MSEIFDLQNQVRELTDRVKELSERNKILQASLTKQTEKLQAYEAANKTKKEIKK